MKKKVLWLITFGIFLIEIGFILLTNSLESLSGYGILDSMYYNKEIVETVINAYGPSGIDIYYQIQILDFIFPLMYGALLFLLLYKSKLMVVPLLAVFMDFGENICIRLMLNSYPNIVDLSTLSFVFTVLKFTFITSAIGLIVMKRLKQRYETKKIKRVGISEN